ncbi:MBL fold metallo-hydrolase [Pseudosulfitobacter sp. DSM 107133]|uniref:MBL fold metallo-hydrolase n=1 Tax=Pseudosulfitobacter sp. DSM 107133 TaxID=2883100 RepID=UPI000DF1D0C8|nr:MBL fold metallo-hydrolase [Pseudosulfitobacter sp. DSM 107133]UOA28913.1 hypothetical protein DSM107133_03672 [Pseudosulfitobacter sp. DSM 107133]
MGRNVHDLGNGLFAYIQEDGSWGWSNSGLITSNGESLLVDTLFNGPLTRDMLAAYRRATPDAAHIATLVNTHANGDHTFGNHVIKGARIIGTTACRDEMNERPAPAFATMMDNWRDAGEAGAFLHEVMGSRFDFSDVGHVTPDVLFDGFHALDVGGLRVELHEMGPAHTMGDAVVFVPELKTVFTGDILFSGGHPILWAGPLDNWLKACDAILGWDVDVVVPGHGPVGDKAAVHQLRDYLAYVQDAATQRYEAGLGWAEAAWDIGMEAYDSWLDRERVVANVANVYTTLSKGAVAPTRPEILTMMCRYRGRMPSPDMACPACGGAH